MWRFGRRSFRWSSTELRPAPRSSAIGCEAFDEEERQVIGQDLMRVQYRWPVGMPLCRSLGDGLWEVRSNLPSRRIARMVFSVVGSRIVVLHGFIKKSQRTPDEELGLARRRAREFEA